MKKQVYWEDVTEGSEIPSLSKVASTRMVVKWAGASGDFNPLHYEDNFAAGQGVGKPIMHGQLKRAFLVQLLTDWIGDEGSLRKFTCQFRGMDYPRLMQTVWDPKPEGETILCKGKVTKKYQQGDEHWVDCEIWTENGKGEKTTLGTASVVLPSC